MYLLRKPFDDSLLALSLTVPGFSPDLCELERPSRDQVLDTTGSPHHDVDAAGKRTFLALIRNPTVHAHGGQVCHLAHVCKHLQHLRVQAWEQVVFNMHQLVRLLV